MPSRRVIEVAEPLRVVVVGGAQRADARLQPPREAQVERRIQARCTVMTPGRARPLGQAYALE
jgi:hypothetical protein